VSRLLVANGLVQGVGGKPIVCRNGLRLVVWVRNGRIGLDMAIYENVPLCRKKHGAPLILLNSYHSKCLDLWYELM
jgi:hypothetical protein